MLDVHKRPDHELSSEELESLASTGPGEKATPEQAAYLVRFESGGKALPGAENHFTRVAHGWKLETEHHVATWGDRFLAGDRLDYNEAARMVSTELRTIMADGRLPKVTIRVTGNKTAVVGWGIRVSTGEATPDVDAQFAAAANAVLFPYRRWHISPTELRRYEYDTLPVYVY